MVKEVIEVPTERTDELPTEKEPEEPTRFATIDEILSPPIEKEYWDKKSNTKWRIRSVDQEDLSWCIRLSNSMIKDRDDGGVMFNVVLLCRAVLEPKIIFKQSVKMNPTLSQRIATEILSISGYDKKSKDNIKNLSGQDEELEELLGRTGQSSTSGENSQVKSV